MTTDVNVSQRIGAALGTRSVTPKERGALARASEGVATWDELPMGAQALVEAIEDRPLTGNAMPDEEPIGKPGKKPGLTAAAPLYGITDLGLKIGIGHTLCDLLTFCRNPLHPGPCKGWKHSLRAVAPGLHETMEKDRLAKVDARRAERAAAAGGKAPKVRALKHERAAAFWRKNADPAPLKAGEHRTLTAPDGTRAEIFQTGAGVTVQVRDGAGASRTDLTKTFPTETQALAHLADVAGKLAGEQDRGGTGPGRAEGGAPVIPAERQRRLDAASAKTKAAFDREGQGKGRDGDGDGKKGEGKDKGTDVRLTRTGDGKGGTMSTAKVRVTLPDGTVSEQSNKGGWTHAVIGKRDPKAEAADFRKRAAAAESTGTPAGAHGAASLRKLADEAESDPREHYVAAWSKSAANAQKKRDQLAATRTGHSFTVKPADADGPVTPPPAKQDDGLDRYRTTPEEYRNHYDGYTDNELKRAAHDERVATQGRPRKEIIADLAKVRAAQDRDVLERNLRERAGGSGGGSTETRPAGVGGNLELTEINGGWKGGRKTDTAPAPEPKAQPTYKVRRDPHAGGGLIRHQLVRTDPDGTETVVGLGTEQGPLIKRRRALEAEHGPAAPVAKLEKEEEKLRARLDAYRAKRAGNTRKRATVAEEEVVERLQNLAPRLARSRREEAQAAEQAKPRGLGGTTGLDSRVIDRLVRNNLANPQQADRMDAEAVPARANGSVPEAVVRAAADVVPDLRHEAGRSEFRRLIGMPSVPKDIRPEDVTEMDVADVRFGDLVLNADGSFPAQITTVVGSGPDRKMLGLGILGLTPVQKSRTVRVVRPTG